jgi:1-acyl-sn-glycerol-3-phosphate acyltransferase
MPVTGYHLAWWRRWLTRPPVRAALRLLFYVLAPVKITGRKNVPLGSAYIAVINHVSLFEAPFIGAFWPEQLEVIGASDVWDRPGQNILARLWGGIPVHRGDYDRAAVDSVLSALRSGEPLLIAPEGGRSHAPGLRQAKPGVAYIAEQTGLPVIPVGIVGTTDDFWHKASRGKRPQLEMHIGKPLQLPLITGKGMQKHASRQRNADLVMRHIAGLLPEEYRGVYSADAIFPEAETGSPGLTAGGEPPVT